VGRPGSKRRIVEQRTGNPCGAFVVGNRQVHAGHRRDWFEKIEQHRFGRDIHDAAPRADRRGQQRLLEEVVRVLRPGGLLVGADSLASNDLREFHHGDTYNPSNRGGCCAGCTDSAADPSRSPSTTT
jgi:SAM-dependent methyltransferase